MSGEINRRDFLGKGSLALGVVSSFLPRSLHSEPVGDWKTFNEVDPAAVRRFVSRLRGPSFLPQDPGYAEACQNWTGNVTKYPGMVVRCAGTEDVADAVQFARQQGLLLAVRGGGHSSNSSCEGGLLVNLSGMKQLQVDPAARVVRAQAGLTGGELDRATCAQGLATVLGECPSVGIAGMGLGGGLGRLMGQHGALCDNLLSAEIVTAEGRVLQASADENPDLFWAIRGGGGNFGIATSFRYRLHPVGPVLSGTLQYPLSEIRTVLRFFGDWIQEAPDELDALIEIGSRILQYAPQAREPVIVINVCCAGTLESAARVLRPLREFHPASTDTIRPMTYLEAQDQGDVRPLVHHLTSSFSPAGRRGFLTALTEEAVEAIAAHCESPPSTSWSLALDHYLHGAVCRVSPEETAFSLRQKGFSVRISSFEEGPTPAEASSAWVQSLHQSLQPFSAGRIYLNYVIDQNQASVRSAFAGNYPRLLQLKRKFDPSNFFRLNPNIRV